MNILEVTIVKGGLKEILHQRGFKNFVPLLLFNEKS